METIAISEFKAKCLALLGQIGKTGKSFVVTKNGKPIAKVEPFSEDDAFETLRGSVVKMGDVISPTGVDWDAMK